MRFAILTDIHGNRAAFQAVLDDLAARGIGRIALLGDIVGYGPDPEWCTARAMDLVAAGALAVKGNHDSAIDNPAEVLNPNARRCIDWTRPRLDAAQRAFLAGLPLTASDEGVFFAHASAQGPADWIYVTSDTTATPSFRSARERVIFLGHVHVPQLFSQDLTGVVREQRVVPGAAVPLIRSRRWLGVIGAVGQPRDGVPEAAYAILDTGANTLTFHRVAYDRATTAARLRAAGLPETLALRLLNGS